MSYSMPKKRQPQRLMVALLVVAIFGILGVISVFLIRAEMERRSEGYEYLDELVAAKGESVGAVEPPQVTDGAADAAKVPASKGISISFGKALLSGEPIEVGKKDEETPDKSAPGAPWWEGDFKGKRFSLVLGEIQSVGVRKAKLYGVRTVTWSKQFGHAVQVGRIYGGKEPTVKVYGVGFDKDDATKPIAAYIVCKMKGKTVKGVIPLRAKGNYATLTPLDEVTPVAAEPEGAESDIPDPGDGG